MKRNHLAITLGIILGVSALTGCTKSSTNDTSISKEKESEENTVIQILRRRMERAKISRLRVESSRPCWI